MLDTPALLAFPSASAATACCCCLPQQPAAHLQKAAVTQLHCQLSQHQSAVCHLREPLQQWQGGWYLPLLDCR